MSRIKWTIEDHRKAASLLLEMDKLLHEFFHPPLNAHPRRITTPLLKIDHQINLAKSLCENEMFSTLGAKLPADKFDIYYPKTFAAAQHPPAATNPPESPAGDKPE